MSVLNLLCPICTEIFRNVEDICSTSCGHVFHYQCMREWQTRYISCPQCRYSNPTTHKLYLSFDETSETVEELRNNLEKSTQELNDFKIKFNDKTALLANVRAESEMEIAQLKDRIRASDEKLRMHKDSQELVANLKETIEDLEKSNTKKSNEIVSLSNKITCSENALDELKKKIDILNVALELALSKNNDQTVECTRLEASNSTIPQDSGDNETVVNELKEEITVLKDAFKKVTTELETEVSNNNELTLECIRLKAMNASTGMNSTPTESSSNESAQIMIYKEKLKVLEHRLKHITGVFEKEITKSTQLEIDKIKLQSFIDRMQLNSSTTSAEINDQVSKRKDIKNTSNFASSSESLYTRPESNQRKNKKKTSFMSSSESLNMQQGRQGHHDSTSNCVVIQGYPSQNLIYPLENTLMLVATNMDIYINKQDIDKINIVGRNSHNLSEKVSLFVRFQHRDMKKRFLAYKNRLSASSTGFLRSVKIKEYFDDRVHDVFLYAKAKLIGNGFNDIFSTNNQIFVKKDVSDSRGIQIYTRQQVDELLKNPCEESSLHFDSNDD